MDLVLFKVAEAFVASLLLDVLLRPSSSDERNTSFTCGNKIVTLASFAEQVSKIRSCKAHLTQGKRFHDRNIVAVAANGRLLCATKDHMASSDGSMHRH